MGLSLAAEGTLEKASQKLLSHIQIQTSCHMNFSQKPLDDPWCWCWWCENMFQDQIDLVATLNLSGHILDCFIHPNYPPWGEDDVHKEWEKAHHLSHPTEEAANPCPWSQCLYFHQFLKYKHCQKMINNYQYYQQHKMLSTTTTTTTKMNVVNHYFAPYHYIIPSKLENTPSNYW